MKHPTRRFTADSDGQMTLDYRVIAGLMSLVAASILVPTRVSLADVDAEASPNFELPGTAVSGAVDDGGFKIDVDDFSADAGKRLFERWPEDLVIAPVPGYSSQFGWSLTIGGGYFLSKQVEDGPPPSIVGGFGMISSNGSRAYGAGTALTLGDGRWRLGGGAGYMDLRYTYFGTGSIENRSGNSIDINQTVPVALASVTWRAWDRLHVGFGLTSGRVDTRLQGSVPSTLASLPDVDLDIAAITLPVSWDSRNFSQFPTSGWNTKARMALYRKTIGSDFDAEVFDLTVNRYLQRSNEDVIALRAVFRTSSGDAPFFLMSTFGGTTDLRGYPSGRYRDKMMYALQAEYRKPIRGRWIATGFAGFGEVAPDFGSFGRDLLPAAGVGLRFSISPKHRISLAVDVAVGKDGSEFYFGVGEAF